MDNTSHKYQYNCIIDITFSYENFTISPESRSVIEY